MPSYTEQDHETWATLYREQMKRVPDYACELFLRGLPRLQFDPDRLPDPQAISARLHRETGWSLSDAQNEYLNAVEWFEHLRERRFPVTNYIRKPEELEFTPLPDVFHDYFGHLAYFTDPYFADLAQAFAPLFFAGDARQQLEISRLWWYTTEFGLIREGGKLKAFGAGLISSIAEMQKRLPQTRCACLSTFAQAAGWTRPSIICTACTLSSTMCSRSTTSFAITRRWRGCPSL
jgi:Phenylalanine 4-hydroxylase (EC 1.14.16.1)